MPMLRNWILLAGVVLVFLVLHQSTSLPAIPLWPDQDGTTEGFKSALVGFTYPQGSKAPKTSYPDPPEYSRMTSNISHYWQSPAYMALPEEFKALKHPRVYYDYKIYKDWNERSMREYYACVGAGKKCPARQKKVVLCSAHWFDEAIVRGWRGGEGVWALSMHKAMRELGYTTLFSTSWSETLQQYQTFPDAVIAVIDHDIHECRKEKGCLKTAEQPRGIPAWKIFDMNFYPGERGINSRYLDGPWTINADFKWQPGSEPWVEAQYIGYSLEHECGDFKPIPLEKRQKSAWFLAKVLSYAYQPQNPWPRDFWQKAKDEPSLGGLRFRGSYDKTSTFKWEPQMGEMVPLEAIDDVPKMNALEFMAEIGNNVALVGMWHPYMSPSPYLALCVGTPFINPIISWDESNPRDRSMWNAQEPRLRWMDPPYVYNVFKDDYEGFVHALKSAMTTPIDKYIVPEMKLDAVKLRVEHWLEADWYTMAAEQRQQRIDDGEEIKWVM